jgi:signal transduction histidine kinase
MPTGPVSSSSKPMAALILGGSIVLILLLWAATLAQVEIERKTARDAAIRANQNRAVAFEQFVMRTFEAADVAALHLAQRFAGLASDRRGNGPPETFSDPVLQDSLFGAVLVADADGQVRYATRPLPGPLDVSDEDAVRQLRAGGPIRMIISRPRVSKAIGRPVVAFTRPLQAPNGSFGGIVTVEMPVERLVEFNQGAAIRPLDLISVIRLDGITLARRTGTRISWGEDLRGKLVMRRQMADPNGTYLGPSGLDGIRRYFSHRRLSGYPVFATVGVGEADVLGDVRRRSHWYYVAMSALTLAIVAFAGSVAGGMTRREEAMRALAGANRKLRDAQRLGRIGDWAFDVAAERFTWSAQMCDMYGRSHDQNVLSCEQVLAYVDPDSRDTLRAALAESIRTAEPRQCEIQAWTGGESPSTRRMLFSPVLDAEGRVFEVLGTDQDITSEKVHEQLRDEVAHIARVDAINTMAATIAHELAQPLTAAANYLLGAKAYARRQAPGDDALVREAIEAVEEQINLTRDIIGRARAMVARGAEEGEYACLPEVVQDAISLLRAASGEQKVAIVKRLADHAAWVAADRIQLQQVLMNLLRNACEAARHNPEPRVTIVSDRVEDNVVKVCVEDNGAGIPDELADVFSPFASTKSAGLGLGLSISRAIVHAYGGRIWIDRSKGEGAAISFTLPVADPKSVRARPDPGGRS